MMKSLIFLSDDFYSDFPHDKYPEISRKRGRPHMQLCLQINGIYYAVPFRSKISHSNALILDKKRRSGLDFTKTVVITDEKYIDHEHAPRLRNAEYKALLGKEHRVKSGLKKYINRYAEAKNFQDRPENARLVQYSTLQYFEKEIGIS